MNLKGLVDSKLSFMPSFVMWFVSGGGGAIAAFKRESILRERQIS
ncbi:hypothetical protein [uncultured Helicobacter sp.]|nr:hypothetical protein [uncultured Helicobacter sp.]